MKDFEGDLISCSNNERQALSAYNKVLENFLNFFVDGQEVSNVMSIIEGKTSK